MNSESSDIYPVFDNILNRKEKEKILKQYSKVFWLTGLSGSGKTTIAIGIEKELNKLGYLTQILDGDNVRTGINNNLDFTDKGRKENIRRIAEVSKLFLHCGIIVIDCFVSPIEEMRNNARDIIGNNDFIEIYINAPLEVCESRDTKGLYKKARKGEIKDFTGINAPFEPPQNPDIEIKTNELSIKESINKIVKYILPLIEYKK
jgi:adenylylsulfate kinase